MLYYSGVTARVGDVDSGNTVTDFLELERERGITIQSAAITFNWPLQEVCPPGSHPKTINLIDTPGHQDFRFEVDRCLPVLDGAVCIIDSVKGVEAHTERVWSSAQEHAIPRVVYVNKLDRDGASFRKSVLEVGTRLNGWPLVCQIPWWEKENFVGVIDVIDRVGYRWKTEKQKITYRGEALDKALAGNKALLDEIEVARERLVEGLAELDEPIMDLFAEDPAKITNQTLKDGIRRAVRSGDGKAIPVFAGASFRHIGVEPLMDAIIDYLPSPNERPDLHVQTGEGKHSLAKLLHEHSEKKGKHARIAAVASVFKVFNHPTEAAKTEVVQHLSTGQIGAMKGLKKARTGDTLLATVGSKTLPEGLRHIQIRPPEIPPAVAFLAMDPYGNVAAQELETLLDQMSRQDPSLRWNRDEKTEQFILQGMGKLHLEVALHHLKQNMKGQVDFGTIEVDYKECLTTSTDPHTIVFDKPVAGKAGKVTSSSSSIPAADVTRRGRMARGGSSQQPIQGCHVTVTVDTDPVGRGGPTGGHFRAQRTASSARPLTEAHRRQGVGLLEPVMLVHISCPETTAGQIQHDISSGAGDHVLEVSDRSAEGSASAIDAGSIYAPPDPYDSVTSLREKKSTRMVEIVAKVPFKEVLDFDQHLRSKTGGRHSMTMAFD
ncbi:elongation factor G 2, partial [Verticillium alfalfae VaMs.102]